MSDRRTPRRTALDVIQVREPCAASWESMAGDDRVRFCAHCSKHVHNLSAMPRDEAERLVCESAGSLCVRFEQSRSGGGGGGVVTLDYQRVRAPRRRWPLWTVVGLCSAGAAFVADYYRRVWSQPPPAPYNVTMGAMVCPPAQLPATGDLAGEQADGAVDGAPPTAE